jgi:hypothetical protein
MLGFYAAMIVGMMLYHLVRREAKAAFLSLGWFAAGVALSTLPWIVYFGVNGAVGPWLKIYLYDNLFLYGDGDATTLAAHAKAMLRAAWSWFTLNWAYAVPTALGVLWMTLRGTRSAKGAKGETDGGLPAFSAAEKAFLWATLCTLALGVFIGGKSYLYYAFLLAAFVPLGAVYPAVLAERLRMRVRVPLAVPACTLALCAGLFSLAASPNTPDLLKPRDETMQYRFAAIVERTPDATLLNYGFMDAGFYTACRITPSVKYFHQTNVHLQEMLDEQIRYIADGVTDYVVTRGKQPDVIVEHYDLIATEAAPEGFWYDTVYLYRRKDLAK